jgi:hypothetical protein
VLPQGHFAEILVESDKDQRKKHSLVIVVFDDAAGIDHAHEQGRRDLSALVKASLPLVHSCCAAPFDFTDALRAFILPVLAFAMTNTSASAQCEGAWVEMSVPGPPAHQDGVMCFDPSTTEVLFLHPQGTKWFWNGFRWEQGSSAGPTGQAASSMAIDPTRQNIRSSGQRTKPGHGTKAGLGSPQRPDFDLPVAGVTTRSVTA